MLPEPRTQGFISATRHAPSLRKDPGYGHSKETDPNHDPNPKPKQTQP